MVMLRYTTLVLLVLLGGFLACEGEKDPAVSTTELGDGIAVLDEGEARDAIEALKNPNEVFKPGQTRFLTADPFQTPGALPSSMWEKGYDQNGILSPTSGNAQGRGDLAEESASLDDADFNGEPGAVPPMDPAAPDGRTADVEEGDIYKVVGNRLYLLNTYKGFMILDVSDPKKSKVLSRLGIFGYPIEMYVQDNTVHALISDALHIRRAQDGTLYFDRVQQSELVAIDIGDEKKPRLLDREPIVGNLMEGKTRKVGDIIYTVSDERDYSFWGWSWEQYSSDGEKTWESKVMVYSFDVGNPDRIAPVGELALIDQTDYDSGFNDFQISATANALMVAKNRWRNESQNNGQEGGVTSGGAVSRADVDYDIAVAEDAQDTAGSDDWVQVDPPTEPKTEPGMPGEGYFPGEERREWCNEYSNWQEAKVSIIDISDEAGAMSLYTTFDLPGMVQDQFKQHYVKTEGGAVYYGLTIKQFNKAYWQEDEQGEGGRCMYENGTENVLHAVDLANAKKPAVVDTLAIGKEQETVKASLFQSDETLFAITSRTMDPLYAIDLSDPKNLTKLSEVDGLNGHISVFRPIEGGDFLMAVGTDNSGSCSGFDNETWFDSRVAVSIVDVRDLSKLVLVDRECLYIKGGQGSYSAVTWNYDQAHKMLGIHDTAELNLITVPASTWIEGDEDSNYPYGHQASIVGAMSWNLSQYLTDPTKKDVLKNRGSVVHPMDEVRRTTIYSAGGKQVGLNISDTWLSFIDFSDLDALKLHGTLELTANTVEVFGFGDYLVKQVVHGDYSSGAYNGEQQGNEFRVVKKGAGADEATVVATFSSGPLSKALKAGNLLLLFRNSWDESAYGRDYPGKDPGAGMTEPGYDIGTDEQDLPDEELAKREEYFLVPGEEDLAIDPYRGGERTEVVIYDLSDPTTPKKRGTAEYEGYLPFYNNYLYGSWGSTGRDMTVTVSNATTPPMADFTDMEDPPDPGVEMPGDAEPAPGLKAQAYCIYCGIDQVSTSNVVLLDRSANFLIARENPRYVYTYDEGEDWGTSNGSSGSSGQSTPGYNPTSTETSPPSPPDTPPSQDTGDDGDYATDDTTDEETPNKYFAAGDSAEPYYNVLVSLDFSNPDKPKFTESRRFPKEWFGLVPGGDGHSLYIHSSEKSDESEVEQLAYYLYYAHKLELSDPAEPVLGEPINIPGTLNKVFLEDGEERFLTTWYQYYKLTEQKDFLGDLPYYSQRSMHLLRVEGSEAELLSSFLLNDWYVKSLAVTETNQVFLVTQKPYYLLAYSLGEHFQYQAYEHLTVLEVEGDALVASYNDDLKTQGARILTVAEDALFLDLEGNGVVVVDVSDPSKPVPRTFLRTMGWLNSILVQEDFAYIPAGLYGLYTFSHTGDEVLELAVKETY